MKPGRIAAVVIGALGALVALGVLAGAGSLLWIHGTQRDAAGFYTSSTERLTTPGYAVTGDVDFGARPHEGSWVPARLIGTVRIRAGSSTADPVFIGIGPQSDVDRWLAGAAHRRVTTMGFGPVGTQSEEVPGTAVPPAPTSQSFWVASTSGTGTRTLTWPTEGGAWSLVVANADGTGGVSADVTVGIRTGLLLPVGIGLAVFGTLLLGAMALLIIFGFAGAGRPPATSGQTGVSGPEGAPAPGQPATSGTPVAGAYPVRLDGHVDPAVSRWLWLIKWLLVIPHVFVLAFLWTAACVLTLVAGVAILFTGRYPRGIFDFNVGVMRWTWRVSFYAVNAFGTDRYPPFSLASDPDFPADLNVDYPERLSRGLVLVKWWLLAIPHYLVVAVFTGGWTWGRHDPAWWFAGGGGLIALLVIIAAVILGVTGRYPDSIFDFVMGMNRWCYRVLAYSALMRDEYPPFRFDSGGTDPGSMPVLPPPPPPAEPQQPDQLIGASH